MRDIIKLDVRLRWPRARRKALLVSVVAAIVASAFVATLVVSSDAKAGDVHIRDVPQDVWREVRIAALTNDMTVKQWVIEALLAALKKKAERAK